MKAGSPVVKHLVLVGGGHSHLAVLMHLGMHPVPGLAVTLISRDINTPYSGSLPGFIAGYYGHDEIHIDLRPLAQFAGARVIQAEVTDLDLVNRQISLPSRPPLQFDLLSLNIGSRPNAAAIPGAAEYAIAVKPIDGFLKRWQDILEAAIAKIRDEQQAFTLAIVGGGPASVELAFSAQLRILRELDTQPDAASDLNVLLLTADEDVLLTHNREVRQFAREELQRRGIDVHTDCLVKAFQYNTAVCADNRRIEADALVYATGASIPDWPGKCGLAISEDGFIEVNRHLQSTSHDFVFAAGDAATIRGQPRPKSGVYAVRQGMPLAKNLVRYATGKSLVSYRPQKHALALMSMGDQSAIASRNALFYQGRWVGRLKQAIDRRFIRKYTELPAMEVPLELAPGLIDKHTEQELRQHAMRCAGCGAKVASNILEEVLQQLPTPDQPDVLTSPAAVEDASLLQLPDGRILVQSVDQIRAFVNDPWLFARIATNHCLSDIYAMGCQPHSALAVVGLPFAARKYMRAQLRELMLGCSEALEENGCALIGGHSAESTELFFGLCVNGFIEAEQLLSKRGMQVGDRLILTKPLGSGTLLAADMRYRASQRWIAAALEHMLISNAAAARIAGDHGVSACTDITGFGLAGHLLEMLEGDKVEVRLDLESIPAMDGALDTLAQGIISSLHRDNSLAAEHIQGQDHCGDSARLQLLFDPQTAGGLLLSVPAAAAGACLEQLRDSGYPQAQIIGEALSSGDQPAIILGD